MSEHLPFWSDAFDMDLLKVIPDVEEALFDAAPIELVTHGHTTFDRLNHPAVWNHDRGIVAFFGLAGTEGWKPESYVTHDPLVSCTFLEVVRDAWVHHYIVVVNHVVIVDTQRMQDRFMQLMGHVRGYSPMREDWVEWAHMSVRGDFAIASGNLERVHRRILGFEPVAAGRAGAEVAP
jgi:hypothetical protein